MTWVKLDDSSPRRLRKAGRDAAWLFVCSLAHVSENLLGDELPDDDVALVAVTADVTERKALALLERLEELGHVERRPEGWCLRQEPSVGKWSRTKQDVDVMKAEKAKAGRASAAAKKKRRGSAKSQQTVQQPVGHAVGQVADQGEPQTRDVSLDYVERLTASDEQPVDPVVNIEGARAARAMLAANGTNP